jgi:hypothetical protein
MEEIFGTSGVYGVTLWTMSMMVAGIAQGKNREGLNWFIASLILTPPIAISLLVIFFDKEKKVE